MTSTIKETKNFDDIDETDTVLKGQGIIWPHTIRSGSEKNVKAKETTDKMSWFGHDTSASTILILTEIDVASARKNVFAIGATSRPGILNPTVICPGHLVRAKKQGLVPLHPHLSELSFSTWAWDYTMTGFLMMRPSFMETCYIPAGVSKGDLIGVRSDLALSTIEDRCCKALWE
eukprot:10525350-Ditylum_brightwellii.AAC.1